MSQEILKQTVEILSAYVSNNELAPNQLVELIGQVHATLGGLAAGAPVAPPVVVAVTAPAIAAPPAEDDEAVEERPAKVGAMTAVKVDKRPVRPEPAVPIEDAVQDDLVICLMCGKGCQALKGHLTRSHKIELDEYRKMFNLPRSFPMVARNYSERRRQLAKDANLAEKLQQGRRRNKAEAEAAELAEVEE